MSPEAPPATALAPGFRFHPTDEELVWYYLKRKVTGQTLRFDAISEADIYKSEPWDLPGKSRLKSRDLEWYFFSALDKKYGNGSRMNRATIKGYWKTTGKDRGVRHNSHIVGMKKTLVFHSGRAPGGERTNWVMHEYRLADEELEKMGISQDGFVLCRVFQKSGLGPPNGNRYAPFVEEEWDDDNENGATVLVPGEEEEERDGVKEESLEDGPVLSMACPSPFPVGGKRFRMESDGSEVSPPVGTQDRGSSTNAPGEKVSSSVMEFPLLESIDRGVQGNGGLSGFLPAGYLKLFGDLQCEIHSVSTEKAAFKIELMSTQAMVGVLQSRIDWLVKENEELNRIVRERLR